LDQASDHSADRQRIITQAKRHGEPMSTPSREPEEERAQLARRLRSRLISRPLWVLAYLITVTAVGIIFNIALGRQLVSLPNLPPITWIAIAAGPVLALASNIYLAFKYQSDDHEGASSLREPSRSARAIFWSGILLLTIAGVLGIGLSLSTAGWILVLLLEVAGIGATVASAELMLRPQEAATGEMTAATPPHDTSLDAQVTDWRLRSLYRDVTVAAAAYRKSAKHWTQANYSLGFLAAVFSGGSGITSLSTASPVVKTTFAVLAVVGAALASLSTSLGANEAQAKSKLIANRLDALARDIHWRPSSTDDSPPINEYVTRFNDLTTVKPKAATSLKH
jgi:hypothetical protein